VTERTLPRKRPSPRSERPTDSNLPQDRAAGWLIAPIIPQTPAAMGDSGFNP
jgi:hypothetical protein